MKVSLILSLFLIFSVVGYAQQGDNRKIEQDHSGFVTNEDRGKAYIITATTQTSTIPGGRGIKNAPRQYSVFLGSGWSSDQLHSQESTLANLLANMPNAAALQDEGIRDVFTVNDYQENLIDLSTRGVSDLAIQGVVSGMFGSGLLTRPTVPTIYVIYLDPAIQSSLAGMNAGKHYLAYFNNFNTSGMRVRYVVVPMNPNSTTAYQTALTAFVTAMLN